ncbi:MAG: putative acetyltransferase [Humisphaera sp.]|nr:putative acetyltransferase [Humisphaera sp.]
MTHDWEVRHEWPHDLAAVRGVNEAAFGRAGEADLIDRLRGGFRVLSLVAETRSGAVVGHVFVTMATIRLPDREIVGAALGPVAVLPAFQRRGIGGALIRTGMDEVERRGDPFVVVLGHPQYYPRFGFEPAGSRHGVRCKWDVSDDVFMIRIFNPFMMQDVRGGLAVYSREFDDV